MTATGDTTISIIGFMGAGKTALARAVAHRLGWPALDLDTEITTATGVSIPRLFEERGEDAFRTIESGTLAEILDRTPPVVLATGGGVVVRENNRRGLRERSWCVFLDVPPAVFLPRIARRRSSRPLARNASDHELISRWEDRLPFYRETAHVCLTARNERLDRLAEAVIRAYQARSLPSQES